MFAAERFNQFIYGREVEVENDHKPLETIVRKPIQSASPRIQLMMLRLLSYKLYVKYVPGKTVLIADALSRAHTDSVPRQEPVEIPEMETRIHSLVTSLPMSESRLKQPRTATANDKSLHSLKKVIADGWPSHRKNTHPSIRQYWAIQDELHIAEGLIFKGEWVVILLLMRAEMLSKIHESHLGMEKCKARACTIMYWPGMANDIGDYVSKCPASAKFRAKNPREPLVPHEVPQHPWAKLGTDIFEFAGKLYLVVVDYFSKYPEVCRLENKTASCVFSHLKSMFARHGILDELIADNMPFGNAEMRQFASQWDFTISTSSPEHPASNGQSERMVGIVKQLMRKANQEGRDPHLALLEYRNTPISGLSYSPSQLLMSRMLRDKMPTSASLLIPKVPKSAYDMLKLRQQKQKQYFDRGTRPLSKLEVGDSVRVKLGRTWTPGIISGKHSSPCSYLVTTENGRMHRRNRRVGHQPLN